MTRCFVNLLGVLESLPGAEICVEWPVPPQVRLGTAIFPLVETNSNRRTNPRSCRGDIAKHSREGRDIPSMITELPGAGEGVHVAARVHMHVASSRRRRALRTSGSSRLEDSARVSTACAESTTNQRPATLSSTEYVHRDMRCRNFRPRRSASQTVPDVCRVLLSRLIQARNHASLVLLCLPSLAVLTPKRAVFLCS